MYNVDPDVADILFTGNFEKFISVRDNSIEQNFLIVHMLCNSLNFKNNFDLTSYELVRVESGYRIK